MLRLAFSRRRFAAPAMLATLLPSLVGPCLTPQRVAAAAVQPDPVQEQYGPYQPYRAIQPDAGARAYPQAPRQPEALAPGRHFATVAEQYLLRAINAERRSRGLAAVHFTAELQEAAYRHAMNMARSNQLEHQLRGEQDLLHRGISAGAHFNKITENIGVGPSILDMHVALMHSPHHRENILDDQVSEIGIAVIQVRGYFWAVEDFSDDAG